MHCSDGNSRTGLDLNWNIILLRQTANPAVCFCRVWRESVVDANATRTMTRAYRSLGAEESIERQLQQLIRAVASIADPNPLGLAVRTILSKRKVMHASIINSFKGGATIGSNDGAKSIAA